MSPDIKTILLRVDTAGDGGPAYEEVRVEVEGENRYKLLQSPGLALGIAADDVFVLTADKRFAVVKRGLNLCIQIFDDSGVEPMRGHVIRELAAIGGRLDGAAEKELVFTVHVDAGFAVVEDVLNRIIKSFPTAEWFYGNVYDPSDGVTPLNWWLDTSKRE